MNTSSRSLNVTSGGTLAEIDFYKHGEKNNVFFENSVGWMEYEQTWDRLEMEEDKVREPEGYDGD